MRRRSEYRGPSRLPRVDAHRDDQWDSDIHRNCPGDCRSLEQTRLTMLRLSDMPADVRQRLLGTHELAATKPRSKAKRPDLKKSAEDVFVLQCRAHKLPMFKREFLFAKAME